MLLKLQEINNKLIEKYSQDAEKLKKYLLIKELLQDKDCFLKMKIETAYSILRDLGFEKKVFKKIYMELINI